MTYEDNAKKLAAGVENLKDETRERIASATEAARREASDVGRALSGAATDLADRASVKLRAAGVDADQLVEAARDQASELQRLIVNEVRARPLRALGVAALVGLAFGLLSSR